VESATAGRCASNPESHKALGSKINFKTGGIHGEENNQRSRLRADRTFGVCANEPDECMAKDT
jgi:hypothetical protein